MTSTMGQGHGRRRDRRPDAAAAHDEVGRRRRGRRPPWPRRAARGRPAPRPCAAPRPRRPRRPTARSAARASGRAGGAGRTGPSTTRGRRRRSRRRVRPGRRPRPGRPPGAPLAPCRPIDGSAAARTAASWPRTIVSTRRSRTSASAWVAAPMARRGSSAGRATSSSSSPSGSGSAASSPLRGRDPGSDRRPRPAGPCAVAAEPARSSPAVPTRRRTPSSASDIAPDRMIGTSGRRTATAATSAASSRDRARARRAAAGRPRRPGSASMPWSSSRRVIASGSVDLGARASRSPAAASGGRHEARERALGAGHDRQASGPPAADLEARQLGRRPAPVDARGVAASAGSAVDDAGHQQVDGGVGSADRPGAPGCR